MKKQILYCNIFIKFLISCNLFFYNEMHSSIASNVLVFSSQKQDLLNNSLRLLVIVFSKLGDNREHYWNELSTMLDFNNFFSMNN